MVQGPSKPLRSVWQRPRVWAPLRATISCRWGGGEGGRQAGESGSAHGQGRASMPATAHGSRHRWQQARWQQAPVAARFRNNTPLEGQARQAGTHHTGRYQAPGRQQADTRGQAAGRQHAIQAPGSGQASAQASSSPHLVVEAHAVEDVTDVGCALVAIRQAAARGAVAAVGLVRPARPPGDVGAWDGGRRLC